jgi:hypothetical protein
VDESEKTVTVKKTVTVGQLASTAITSFLTVIYNILSHILRYQLLNRKISIVTLSLRSKIRKCSKCH